ncbi:FAD-dependent oxidoreductase [Hamadaea tsunoensis]|uniref:FAD-dependent oxidoreductase n=1 Tax=Hamadaea tsunoensis TaxID=53368 RepID=UPI000400CEF8|nr:FAD-dependent oxidoreductase [Hamadaea tsunoensis]
MSAQQRHGHAIVLGASIAGLAAARVLSESFAKVTVFDRDELPAGHHARRGVPQGEHTHGLLARGRQVLEELFEDFIPEVTALGAIPIDVQRDVLWINDGHQLANAESGLLGLCISRPTLEGYVRTRVAGLSNVEIRDRHEALGYLTSADRTRVTGVRVLPKNGDPVELAADLVIDATGRGNRGSTWLTAIGYEPAAEEHVDPQTVYMTREFRRAPGTLPYAGIVESPWPDNPVGGVAIAVDGDRWMVTLLGCGPGQAPPADIDAFVEFTKRLPHPAMYELVSTCEPVGPPLKLRLPTSVRRRYEHLRRLPEGLVSIGDSVCAFNPAYGQGMTSAIAQAMALRDCLARGRSGLPKRFYAAAAKIIDVPWSIAVGADLRFEHVAGERTRQVEFLNGYVGRLHVAAAAYPAVGTAFLKVANLMAPPPALFAPNVLARVLLHGTAPARPVVTPAEREKVSVA